MSEYDRLSQIDTVWSVVRRAHGDRSQECQAAQQNLLDRYGFAIRRYLLAALRDETAADDVFQEFALAFVRGDYQRADPERGKFRNFLKTILFRLVADFRREQYRRLQPPNVESPLDVISAPPKRTTGRAIHHRLARKSVGQDLGTPPNDGERNRQTVLLRAAMSRRSCSSRIGGVGRHSHTIVEKNCLGGKYTSSAPPCP